MPERFDAVFDAIYAAFGIGRDDMFGIDQRGRDLAELARVLLQLMPSEAEVQGLLALMPHGEARRSAPGAFDGRYVPLSEQDPKQWVTDRAVGLAEDPAVREFLLPTRG